MATTSPAPKQAFLEYAKDYLTTRALHPTLSMKYVPRKELQIAFQLYLEESIGLVNVLKGISTTEYRPTTIGTVWVNLRDTGKVLHTEIAKWAQEVENDNCRVAIADQVTKIADDAIKAVADKVVIRTVLLPTRPVLEFLRLESFGKEQ